MGGHAEFVGFDFAELIRKGTEVGFLRQSGPTEIDQCNAAQALPHIPDSHQVLVLYGDVPLISHATLAQLLGLGGPRALSLLTAQLPDPQGYGVDVAKGTLIYHRWGNAASGQGTEFFIIVLNFSQTNQTVDVPFPNNGDWLEMLSDQTTTVTDFWIRGQVVESNWGKVYFRRS